MALTTPKSRPRSGPRASDTPTTRLFSLLVCYDLADDDRRADVSQLLSSVGVRVQLSVYECRVRGRTELDRLRSSLRAIIDEHEDQVRIYNVGARQASPDVLGQRELEEWRDFRII